MYLLIGSFADLCCSDVRLALEKRGEEARIITHPMEHPLRFSWILDSTNSTSKSWFASDEGPSLSSDEVSGVLVRSRGGIDPRGWQPDDLAYMQAEMQAALLAWLWSLSCPVINRWPASYWYRPQPALLSWYALLEHCGLPLLETLVTNGEEEAIAFGEHVAERGVAGLVYGPLMSTARYLVADDAAWTSLRALQRYTPVSLYPPHGKPHLACVVGEQVIWEGPPPAEASDLEPALRRFTHAAGLAFVEVALAPVDGVLCTVAVEPNPHLDHFDASARQAIVECLVDLLMETPAQ